MKVGFTGTRSETTCEQHGALCYWVQTRLITEWHHGCCIGADDEGASACKAHAPKAKIVAHPPSNRSLICHSWEEMSDEKREPLPYLARNCVIVDEADILLACPKGPEEQRSGTWATVRYARKQNKRIVIVYPDGTITTEN